MAPGEFSTNTDPRTKRSWRIADRVIQLREWGSDRIHALPDPPVKCKVGSASTCELCLVDPEGLLSREHAELVPLADQGWKIRDWKSKNGLRVDGERSASFRLRPGIVITIGGLRLIAESPQLIGLLAVLRRFLGWAPERQGDVDEAVSSLREWGAQRADLVVVGDGNLAPPARRLHDLALGRDASFAVYDKDDLGDALRAATGGTLCVVSRRQVDALAAIDQVQVIEQAVRPQLIVCTGAPTSAATLGKHLHRPVTITMPPLSSRLTEIERIALESATDIAAELGALGPGFNLHDLERLGAIEFDSLDDIEDTVRRIVAIRTWGVTAGAAKLGLDHSSLSGWARRSNRKLTT